MNMNQVTKKLVDQSTRVQRHRAWLAGFVAALILLAHFPALQSDFVWDDLHFVETWLHAFNSPSDFFFPPKDIPSWPAHYYRPLGIMSLKLDYFIFGRSFPLGWHIVNLIIHFFCTWQVGCLVRRWSKMLELPMRLEVIAMSLFAVHPIHVESVNWVAGRSDPLAVAFLLISINYAWRHVDTNRRMYAFASGITLLLGLLCKEVAIAAPVLFTIDAIVAYFANKLRLDIQEVRSTLWRQCTAYFTAVMTYLAMRYAASAPTSGNASRPGPSEMVEIIARAVAYYLQQLVPLRAQVVYPDPSSLPSIFQSLQVFLYCCIGLVGLSIFAKKSLRWMIVVGVGWTVGGLWPSLLVIVNATDSLFISERYLYLPSIGYCIIVASLVSYLSLAMQRLLARHLEEGNGGTSNAFSLPFAREYRYSIILLPVCVSLLPILLFYGVSCCRYGLKWVDSPTLWNYSLSENPGHGTALLSLLYYYELQGDVERRGNLIQYAHKVRPDMLQIEYMYAEWLRKKGEADAAVKVLKNEKLALESLPILYLELARSLTDLNRLEEAKQSYEMLVKHQPNHLEAHLRLATLVSDARTAKMHLLEAMLIAPDNPVPYELLADLHEASGDMELAKAARQRAAELKQ